MKTDPRLASNSLKDFSYIKRDTKYRVSNFEHTVYILAVKMIVNTKEP